jgi:hypothetical protein
MTRVTESPTLHLVITGVKPIATMPSKGAQKDGAKYHQKPARNGGANQSSANSPRVTEDDLLSFQFRHFGDDSRPAEWFVSPSVALAYDPNHDPNDEDGLGYYPDGVKRTLTDANVEWFRAQELHGLKQRQEKREAERLEREAESEAVDQHHSPVQQEQKTHRGGENVPYDERKKRSWEGFIAGKDVVQGSLTHRRIARELDDQKVEAVEMDY